MENIGLQTYRQNFTVDLPFPGVSELRQVSGVNVYGILRAPRIAGTEAVVLSVPYNQGNNKGALALMLSFADHCRSKFKLSSKSNCAADLKVSPTGIVSCLKTKLQETFWSHFAAVSSK